MPTYIFPDLEMGLESALQIYCLLAWDFGAPSLKIPKQILFTTFLNFNTNTLFLGNICLGVQIHTTMA